ncbi:hypothetical protein ACHWQZ_G004371 [Mnemiopsis leidyi]
MLEVLSTMCLVAACLAQLVVMLLILAARVDVMWTGITYLVLLLITVTLMSLRIFKISGGGDSYRKKGTRVIRIAMIIFGAVATLGTVVILVRHIRRLQEVSNYASELGIAGLNVGELYCVVLFGVVAALGSTVNITVVTRELLGSY